MSGETVNVKGQSPSVGSGSSGSGSLELEAAYAKLVKAAEEYGKLAPKRPEPTEPPQIAPTLLHAAPSNFHRGYNMMLDAGGYMPGKVPVVVVPARPQDLRRYARKRTVRSLLAHLGLSSPNNPDQPRLAKKEQI